VGSLERRLEILEGRLEAPALPLSAEAEFEGVYNTWWSHSAGNTVGLFTDREINLLGAFYVFREVPDRKHTFPSGGVVEWADNRGGTTSLSVEGDVQVEDLPERISKNVDRMDPVEQPTRERYLREDPRRYSEHILGAYRISDTKRPPKYIPRRSRGEGRS
jgi:hypothetical protein